MPLKLGKSDFRVRDGFGINMKVEEIFKTSVSGQNTHHENVGKILETMQVMQRNLKRVQQAK
ncbi:hypothetical protein GCM10010301_73550 [Streptomyces plicatus]|nr:hypothetical protein GCM10010301_73550 [Streptomyces plicatus]